MTDHPCWRKSSFSGSNGDCVEFADTGGTVLVRNSNHTDRGTLTLSPASVTALVDACRNGEMDDLA